MPSMAYFVPAYPHCYQRMSASCDLFVDSFVYGAHTTAADALWAGLPLLTLRGYGVGKRVNKDMR